MTNLRINKSIRRLIPSLARATYNPFFKLFLDLFDLPARVFFKELRKIPPNHLRVRIGVGKSIFANQINYIEGAKNFWFHAFANRLCTPSSTIVDIGCGCGRYAQHLRDYKFKSHNFSGKYIGIDVDRDVLEWCRRHFDQERFDFVHSIHKTKTYKNDEASDDFFVIPVPDSSVDFVFSVSLYTHLLENELENYTREAYRVLRPGCYMSMSCFCLDYPPPTFGDRHTFKNKIGNAHVESLAVPEAAVAYEKKFLFEVAGRSGFRSVDILHSPDDFQPMLICLK